VDVEKALDLNVAFGANVYTEGRNDAGCCLSAFDTSMNVGEERPICRAHRGSRSGGSGCVTFSCGSIV
jgi:hypothetical protein